MCIFLFLKKQKATRVYSFQHPSVLFYSEIWIEIDCFEYGCCKSGFWEEHMCQPFPISFFIFFNLTIYTRGFLFLKKKEYTHVACHVL